MVSTWHAITASPVTLSGTANGAMQMGVHVQQDAPDAGQAGRVAALAATSPAALADAAQHPDIAAYLRLRGRVAEHERDGATALRAARAELDAAEREREIVIGDVPHDLVDRLAALDRRAAAARAEIAAREAALASIRPHLERAHAAARRAAGAVAVRLRDEATATLAHNRDALLEQIADVCGERFSRLLDVTLALNSVAGGSAGSAVLGDALLRKLEAL